MPFNNMKSLDNSCAIRFLYQQKDQLAAERDQRLAYRSAHWFIATLSQQRTSGADPSVSPSWQIPTTEPVAVR
jgi:hypothetical protein